MMGVCGRIECTRDSFHKVPEECSDHATRTVPPPISEDVLAPIAGVLSNLTQLMKIPLEASVGYRSQCEAAGFSPTMAEMMATEFHRQAMSWLFDQVRGQR